MAAVKSVSGIFVAFIFVWFTFAVFRFSSVFIEFYLFKFNTDKVFLSVMQVLMR